MKWILSFKGMSPTEAMKYHADCLEMSDDYNESLLADASQNPKSTTVYHWHSKWRTTNLGNDSANLLLDILATDFMVSKVYLSNL